MVSTMGMEMSERHKSTRFDFYVAVFLILSIFLGLTREGIQSRKKGGYGWLWIVSGGRMT